MVQFGCLCSPRGLLVELGDVFNLILPLRGDKKFKMGVCPSFLVVFCLSWGLLLGGPFFVEKKPTPGFPFDSRAHTETHRTPPANPPEGFRCSLFANSALRTR